MYARLKHDFGFEKYLDFTVESKSLLPKDNHFIEHIELH